MRRGILLAATAITMAFQAGSVRAQDANPFANRKAELPPALSFMVDRGAKLTYLGDEGGLKAYMSQEPGGKFQPVYVTQDGQYLVVGILVHNGVNVTVHQVEAMQQRWEEARRQMADAQKQLAGAATPTGTPSATDAPAPTPVTAPVKAPSATTPTPVVPVPVVPVPNPAIAPAASLPPSSMAPKADLAPATAAKQNTAAAAARS